MLISALLAVPPHFAENGMRVWITDPPGTTTIAPRQVIPGRYLSPHFLNNSPQVFAFDVDLYRNSYPGYQVAVARRGDTAASVAARIGLSASELANYNAIDAIGSAG